MHESDIVTLGNLLDATFEHPTIIEGLPDGVPVEVAAARLLDHKKIRLKRLSFSRGYFKGWATEEGTPVITEQDEHHLFTLFYPQFGASFTLRIEEAGRNLIEQK